VLRVASMRHFPPRAVRRSIEYIHANLAGAIRLKDIANAAAMSMFRLSRAFRASTGATLHRYLTRARVERVKGPSSRQRDFPTRVT
jgi:transcriptional regulator GlxA family with amidase domain